MTFILGERDRPAFLLSDRQDRHLRDIARIIYNVVYMPGEVDYDGRVMPPFEEALTEETGGSCRALEAAQELLLQRLLPTP